MRLTNLFENVLAVLKIILAIFLVLIQFIIIYFIVFQFNEIATYSYVILQIAALSFLVKILGSNHNYAYKLSWTTAMLVFPSTAIAFYLLFGSKRLIKKRKKIEQAVVDKYKIHNKQNKGILKTISNRDLKTEIRLLYDNSNYPVYQNTEVEYFPLGELFFQSLIEDLKKAQKFILMEFFIVSKGQLFDQIYNILIDKVKNGVEVYFMYDATGSLTTAPRKALEEMQRHGIKIHAYNNSVQSLYSYLSYRSHRKIVVIDGVYSYTGGNNIADEYINAYERFGHWKDMGIKLYGEATKTFTQIFFKAWLSEVNEEIEINNYLTTCYIKNETIVVPFADGPTNTNSPAKYNYMKIIGNSSDYIYITTPYLIIDDEMMAQLILAARSGVDVKIVVPGVADKKFIYQVTKAYFGTLLREGVEIYLYTPGFIHGKMLISDDEVTTIGSINFDYRSLAWNYECGVYVANKEFTLTARADFMNIISQSHLVTYKEWKKGYLFSRMFNGVLKIIAPLL